MSPFANFASRHFELQNASRYPLSGETVHR